MSPEEDRTRDAVDSEPKHYQLSYSGPCKYMRKRGKRQERERERESERQTDRQTETERRVGVGEGGVNISGHRIYARGLTKSDYYTQI